MHLNKDELLDIIYKNNKDVKKGKVNVGGTFSI